MAFIETNDGTNLSYKDWGTGKPIVFVHGWCINCDSWEWEYVMNALPEHGVRCVSYDQHGCGRSDQPWTGYDYDTLADDLATLINQLELDEVTLVRHSMGCGVITRYLSRRGEERVARVVMLGTTTPLGGKTEDQLGGAERLHLDSVAAAIQKDRARYVSELAPGFLGVEKADDIVSQALLDWGVGLTLQASPRAAVAMLRSTFESDHRRELSNITDLRLSSTATQTRVARSLSLARRRLHSCLAVNSRSIKVNLMVSTSPTQSASVKTYSASSRGSKAAIKS